MFQIQIKLFFKYKFYYLKFYRISWKSCTNDNRLLFRIFSDTPMHVQFLPTFQAHHRAHLESDNNPSYKCTVTVNRHIHNRNNYVAIVNRLYFIRCEKSTSPFIFYQTPNRMLSRARPLLIFFLIVVPRLLSICYSAVFLGVEKSNGKCAYALCFARHRRECHFRVLRAPSDIFL